MPGRGEGAGDTSARAGTYWKEGGAHAEEVRVDPGSDSGRDDYGLPPVDVQIPDDARDLDRDVQAYYREVRALRRRSRLQRVTGPLIRRGLIIPIVAICLAVGLVAGTLFTVRTGRLLPAAAGRPSPGVVQRPKTASTAGTRELPDATVLYANRQVPLHELVPAVLTWVPLDCSCAAALSLLAKQATQAKVNIYFVGTTSTISQLRMLASRAGHGDLVVNDTDNVLATTFKLSGLSAVLAHGDASVHQGDVLKELSSSPQLESQFQSFAATASTSPALPPTTTTSLRAAPQRS
jgi:hypothetical protein